MTSLTCQSCGRSFAPRPELLERFPGWEPKECPSCYRAATGSGTGSGSSRPGSASKGGASRRRGGTHDREENLSLADVLLTYEAGPDTGVFTDGSANPNPGPGGWGAVYVVDGEVIQHAHGHEPQTTNNRMELRALIEGIDLVPQGTHATIYTDSKLVEQTMNEWAAGWRRRGWKRKTGPVENLDLVKEAFAKLEARPELEVKWIKAHAGARWNEYADSLSTAYTRDEL